MAIEIGIIGGSGLYDMAELTDREDKVIVPLIRKLGIKAE